MHFYTLYVNWNISYSSDVKTKGNLIVEPYYQTKPIWTLFLQYFLVAEVLDIK